MSGATQQFSLVLGKPVTRAGVQPDLLARLDLNPQTTSLQFSSTAPGGWNGLTVQFLGQVAGDRPSVPRLPQGGPVRPFGHVQVWTGSALVWEGRIVQRTRDPGSVTGVSKFVAEGYGVSATTDNVLTSVDPTLQSSGAILRRMAATLAPALQIAQGQGFVEPGLTHALADFDGQTLAQALDTLSKEGASVGALMDWFAWERQTLYLLPRQAPARPDYQIDFDAGVTDWTEDFHDTVGSIDLRYTPVSAAGVSQSGVAALVVGAAGSGRATASAGASPNTQSQVRLPQPATDPTFLTRYGLSRTALVAGSTLTDVGAAQQAQTQLSLRSQPVISCKVTRQNQQGLRRPGGLETPPWLVRAGQWIAIGTEPALPLVKCTYSVESGALELEVGARSPGQQALIWELVRVAKHAKAGTNPTTGGIVG